MMAQYFEIKQAHPDMLLFYRMGDFYEMFFEDAVMASEALDITLTKRGQKGGTGIPMCGVPFHAADSYLIRLIQKGFRVAVCDQVEEPAAARKRGAKAVVKRAVSRVVTPGTVTEDTLLDGRSHNFLAGMAEAQGQIALAWVDMSTGDLQTQAVALTGLGASLARVAPRELLVPERFIGGRGPSFGVLLDDWRPIITSLPDSRFDSANGTRRLEDLFGVRVLDGFGAFTRSELAAAGALVDYIGLTQKGRLPRLSPPRRWQSGTRMEIDVATRNNLELGADPVRRPPRQPA